MKNPVLSIIVPVYNVEPYLSKCIDSVLDQIFTDFELILIDDGSTDSSGSICDDYKERDNRIIVIHKRNGGQSSARNAGLDIARGQYISFIDSDDAISKDLYAENIPILLSDLSIDFLRFPLVFVYPDGKKIVDKVLEEHIYGIKKAFEFWSDNGSGARGYVCENIYKHKIFDRLRFPEGMIFEDCYIQGFILEQVDHIYISNIGAYLYLQRENSTTNSALATLKRCYDDLNATITYMEKMKRYNVDMNIFMKCMNRTMSRAIRFNYTFADGQFESYYQRMRKISVPCWKYLASGLAMKQKMKMIFIQIIGAQMYMSILRKIVKKRVI